MLSVPCFQAKKTPVYAFLAIEMHPCKISPCPKLIHDLSWICLVIETGYKPTTLTVDYSRCRKEQTREMCGISPELWLIKEGYEFDAGLSPLVLASIKKQYDIVSIMVQKSKYYVYV